MPVSSDSDAPPSVGTANLRAMQQDGAVRFYAAEDYLDPAEKLLYEQIAPEARGRPILDIGVGGGRTIGALTHISSDYTAIDYSQAMVDAVCQRHPTLRILHGDARDLSRFATGSIFLVVFSCAGIDMVSAKDRLTILREIRRVLSPGGAFIFSTHCLEFRAQEAEPKLWDVAIRAEKTANPVKYCWRVLRALPTAKLRLQNYRKLNHLTERHANWAILNSKYHDFSTLMHYISLPAQIEQLVASGFEPAITAYEGEGRKLNPGDTPREFRMHFMARAAATGS